MSMLWKIMVHEILDQVNLVCRNQLWNPYMFPGAPTKLKVWPRCGAYLMTPSPLLFKNIQYTCWHVIVGSLQLLTKKQSTEVKYFSFCLREVIKKKNGKKAVRLTAWVDPPPSPEAVNKMWKILDKLSYLGLFCHFIRVKMSQNFHKIEAVRLEGCDPPSPP